MLLAQSKRTHQLTQKSLVLVGDLERAGDAQATRTGPSLMQFLFHARKGTSPLALWMCRRCLSTQQVAQVQHLQGPATRYASVCLSNAFTKNIICADIINSQLPHRQQPEPKKKLKPS